MLSEVPLEPTLPTNGLAADSRFYHRLTKPGAGDGFWDLLSAWFHNRGLWLLATHRMVNFCSTHRDLRNPLWWLARLAETPSAYLNMIFSRSEIRGDCQIECPVYLSNRGYIICGAQSIGAGSVVHDHCTFGFAVADRKEGRPVIGRDVWIGPGCIIAGTLTVGDGATILPGSFLTYSVPP